MIRLSFFSGIIYLKTGSVGGTMRQSDLTGRIIGAAIEVHKFLGPGLLESTYETCLAHELQLNGLDVKTQVQLPLVYKGKRLEQGYRLDLLVEDQVIVEVKAVESTLNIHKAQLLTYLKLTGFTRGLLINFNVTRLIHGIHRLVNNLDE